jgi:putative ABC transport system substrate-binding protein
MRRREFIALICGAATAWPLAARAQQAPQVSRVGFVYAGSKAAAALRIEAILSGLRVSGYAAPAQVEIAARTAEGDPAQIAPLVAEVIAKNVNVFIVNGPAVLRAAHLATRTIPIVALDLETDPVASGVAASLARPGGNITGVFLDFPDFTAKLIEMLVESNPKVSRTAVLWDPSTGTVQMESVKKAGEKLNVELDVLDVQRPSDFDTAFLMASQRGGHGDAVITAHCAKRAGACRTCSSSPLSGHYPFPRFRAGRRLIGLWAKSTQLASADRCPCW